MELVSCGIWFCCEHEVKWGEDFFYSLRVNTKVDIIVCFINRLLKETDGSTFRIRFAMMTLMRVHPSSS